MGETAPRPPWIVRIAWFVFGAAVAFAGWQIATGSDDRIIVAIGAGLIFIGIVVGVPTRGNVITGFAERMAGKVFKR